MRQAQPADYGQMPEGDTSLASVFSELNRKKRWIILPTFLALVASVLFVNIVTPKYTGEARVLLENRDSYFTRPDKEQRGTDPPLDSEAVQSQVQTIMSRDIAKAAIKKLDLASREEFDPVKKDPGALKRVLVLLGLSKDPLAVSPEERVLENYFEKLLVFNVGKSRVISVEFSSKDPELAYKAANTIADEYITFQSDAKKETTHGASAWLAKAIEPMRARVAEAEAKVEAYRSQSGLLIGASNATIVTQQLGEMNTQMSSARAVQTELQAKARMIREALRTGRVFETSEVVNNELVRRLLEQRVGLKTQMALEERSLLPGHPRMKELSAQLADLEGQIRTAAERTARTMENDARVAGERVKSLQTEFDAQKKNAASSNESEVQLRALEREARALRDNYEQYLAKYRDALARDADAAAPADARVISRAVMPQKPAFPKKVPIILLATLATMVLSCAIIVTRFLFSTDGAQPGYGQHYYGEVVPPAPVQPAASPVAPPVAPPATAGPRFAAASPPPPVPTEAGEALLPLAQDLAALKQAGQALMASCHAEGGEVVSTATALPLARLLSRAGSAILVDLSGQGAVIEQAISRLRPPGVTDMLAGTASFGDIIHRDRASRLHAMPFGSRPDMLPTGGTEAFADMIEALAMTYDFVVFDLGASSVEIPHLAPHLAAAIMVAARDDSDPAILKAFQRLDARLPGRVTIVVEEPVMPAPHPANDPFRRTSSAA